MASTIMFITFRNSKLSLINYLLEKEQSDFEYSETESHFGLCFFFTIILNSYIGTLKR